jgi:hypothetical protein
MMRYAEANKLVVPEKLPYMGGKQLAQRFRKTRTDWLEYANECNKELLTPETIELLDGLMQWSYFDRFNFFKKALDLPLYTDS